MSKRSILLINADDFGLNSSVNKAIVESFDKRFINSATLMANMLGFEEAVGLAHKHHIIDRIGIHLNLNEGHLLTSNILSENLFNRKNNAGLGENRKNLFFLSKNTRHLIYKEFGAQIEKVKKVGIQISHIDTHHHIHEIWPITQIVLTLLKTYRIPSMRILNNLNRKTKFYKTKYRNFVNIIIAKNDANFSDFFGNQLEAISLLRNQPLIYNNKKIEIMVHPDFTKNGSIVDKIEGQEYSFKYFDDFVTLIFSD